MKTDKKLKVAISQIAPVFLDKYETLKKVEIYLEKAADSKCDLVVFGEGLVPGYPFWLSLTHASKFNDKMQKTIHAHYASQAVCIENGDLNEICRLSKELGVALYLGIIERPKDRGGHSLYCSLVFISKEGKIESVHRKLQPTYEERLTWASGDGNGLKVHDLEGFCLGGLNCWENWMPLVRSSLYAQGENVHVAVWPGSIENTKDISLFIAKESRSYVISASSIMRRSDLTSSFPYADEIRELAPEIIANGGSCIVSPEGEWLIPPVENEEKLIVTSLNYNTILEERQNFDPSGHYSRPDVTQLSLNTERMTIIK